MNFIFISFIFRLFLVSRPVQLCLIIIPIVCFISGFISFLLTEWFSFLIFLLYVGGILVLFVYFSTLTPNQRFSKLILYIWRIFSFFSFFSLWELNFRFVYNFNNLLAVNIISYNQYLVYFILIIFLFVTLIIVVKLTLGNKIPIRSFN